MKSELPGKQQLGEISIVQKRLVIIYATLGGMRSSICSEENMVKMNTFPLLLIIHFLLYFAVCIRTVKSYV